MVAAVGPLLASHFPGEGLGEVDPGLMSPSAVGAGDDVDGEFSA
jgi:hypothetical protein